MGVAVSILVYCICAVFVVFVALLLVIDMVTRVDYLKEKLPWLQWAERKKWQGPLLLVCIGLLIADGYEFIGKELPDVTPPVVTFPGIDPGAKDAKITQMEQQIAKLEALNRQLAHVRSRENATSPKGDSAGYRRDIATVSALADKGSAIQSAWINSNDDVPLVKGYNAWLKECISSLQGLDDPSYAIQFKNAHGSAFMGCPTNHSANGCGYWQEIAGKNETLMSITKELRQQH